MEKEKQYNGRVGERQIRENHLDFLDNLRRQGVEIGQDNIALLIEKGYIDVSIPKEEPVEQEPKDNINEFKLSQTLPEHQAIDSQVDIVVFDEQPQTSFDIITDQDLEERRKRHKHIFEGRSTEILRKDWLPDSVTKHSDDFIHWIDSINNLGFKNRIHYRKFSLYCQQAYTWLQDKSSYTDFYDEDKREEYQMRELERCADNKLYFLNKYIYYKEGSEEGGKVKYIASPVHEVLAYLDDCGYSVGFGKGRQQAATTTLMALDVHDCVFKTNHFMKFITEDVEKAQEIFEDKLKFAFAELPWWMRPDVLSERDNLFKLGYKPEKGSKEGVGSKIMVVAPKRTAVAGGAPQKVKIDEAGNIGLLSKMLNNARPTMLYYNPKTKQIEVKRQVWWWGTGGETDKGGKSFEVELLALFKAWNERDFSSATIPLFFDWTCRPGATQEDYDREKKVAYSTEGPEGKDKIIEFHQSWPSSISDVFKTSAKTLFDDEFLDANLERIRNEKVKHQFTLQQSGYFEPIYDLTKPADEKSDVPYKIIGAEFIPTADMDPRKAVTIFSHPKAGWTNRYFQGTDPIDTATGLSKFSSTVWDKYWKTPVACLNFRIKDHKQVFLQALLLRLYYDTAEVDKKGIWELVESNRGTSYTDYVTNKGYDDTLVLNFQLPLSFQNKSGINDGVGIDNKGVRNTMIINHLDQVISAYADRIYLDIYFEQLKTFTCDISDKTGKEMWGPMNKKYFNDDSLFSLTFSYICAELCFPELVPADIQKKSTKRELVSELRYDKDFNLIRVTRLVQVA